MQSNGATRHLPPSALQARPALVVVDESGEGAEFAAIHAEMVALPMEFGTAHNLLTRGQVGVGMLVAVIGAEQSIVYACLRLARHRGAEILAQCGSTAEAHARAAGATLLPVNRPLPACAFDAVIDLSGSESWHDSLSALRPRGRYVTRGAVTGAERSAVYLNDLPLFDRPRTPREVFAGLITVIEAPYLSAVPDTQPFERSALNV